MKWKISSKIMVAIMISAAALSSIIGSIVLSQAGNVIEENALNNLQSTAEAYAKEFSITTEKVESTLDAYIASIISTIDIDRAVNEKDVYIRYYQDEKIVPLTKEFAEMTEGIFGIYFDIDPSITPDLSPEQNVYGAWYLDKFQDGKIVREPLELKKNFYPENIEMQWYYKPIKEGKGVWSKPYKDIYTGYYMISYNKPVYINNVFLGVAGIDIIFEDIISMVESVEVYKTGYAVLLDQDFDFIVHSETVTDKEFNYHNLMNFEDAYYKKLEEKIIENSSGVAELGKGHDKKIAGFSFLNNGYLLVIEAKSFEILEELNRVRSIIDIIIILGVLFAAILAYSLGKVISKPVERLGKMIQRMMHFDFSSEINDRQIVNTNSDSGRMIIELSKLRETVNNSIITVQKNSNKINTSSEKIEKLLEKSKALLEKIDLICESENKNNTYISTDIKEINKIVVEIEKLVKDIKDTNEKNIKISDLFKTD